MPKLKKNNLFYFIFLFLFFFAIYLSYVGGYGSDEDTLPMITTFEQIYYNGDIFTSRFTGYPVAEIGIGFLSFYFGSFLANIVTFSFLIISLVFIYLTFNTKQKNFLDLFPIFLILCLSNPIIFFENLEPIDYSWSLAPFAIGCFLYTKKKYEIAMLLFVLCIGARINFSLFVIIFVLFDTKNKNLNDKIIYLFCCLFFASLFYLPVWYTHKFGFEWFTAARPIEQGFYGLLSRFIYKIIHLFTLLSFILISFYVLNKKIINAFLSDKRILYLFISNLFIFLWIPAEYSYLLLGLILFYFFLIKNLSTNKIIFIIILNFSTWFIQFDFLDIKYRYNILNDCKLPVQALDASFKFKTLDGSVEEYFKTRKKIICWVDRETERGKKIINGKALK
tara:strand:+ start:807 stop:1982 length:1176 start_codon:yes stop_codon:yes gene_type:complete